MRVYVNGIDCGGGRVYKQPTALNRIKVIYHEAMYPTYYPADECIFTTRFGKKCMIVGGDYSEEDITTINKEYAEYLKSKGE